jgi:hypothetical protein
MAVQSRATLSFQGWLEGARAAIETRSEYVGSEHDIAILTNLDSAPARDVYVKVESAAA